MLPRRKLPDARSESCWPDLLCPPRLIPSQGLVIPEVLRPYMQGRDFLPWVKELPKNLQRKQA